MAALTEALFWPVGPNASCLSQHSCTVYKEIRLLRCPDSWLQCKTIPREGVVEICHMSTSRDGTTLASAKLEAWRCCTASDFSLLTRSCEHRSRVTLFTMTSSNDKRPRKAKNRAYFRMLSFSSYRRLEHSSSNPPTELRFGKLWDKKQNARE